MTAIATPAISAPPDVIVGEGDGFVDLTVSLSAPGLNAVAVSYTTGSSSAVGGTSCNSDYVGVSGILNFAPGATTRVVRVEILNCAIVEGAESFTLNLSAPVGATIARASTRVRIVEVAVVPGAPRGVLARAADASAHVTWLPPASTGGSAITRYTVTARPSNRTCSTSGTLRCTVTGLTNGVGYTFTVTASNAVGTGPASAPTGIVRPGLVPGAPTGSGTRPDRTGSSSLRSTS